MMPDFMVTWRIKIEDADTSLDAALEASIEAGNGGTFLVQKFLRHGPGGPVYADPVEVEL